MASTCLRGQPRHCAGRSTALALSRRQDGRNVNNWHWSETSYTEWAREKLGARFEGVAIGDGTRSAGKLLSLETMKGDVTVQSRKQKRFPLCAARVAGRALLVHSTDRLAPSLLPGTSSSSPSDGKASSLMRAEGRPWRRALSLSLLPPPSPSLHYVHLHHPPTTSASASPHVACCTCMARSE